jgi:hypothetical protein
MSPRHTLLLLLAALVVAPTSLWAQTGYVDITSSPSGISIYLDGALIGRTPLTGIEVAAGARQLRGEQQGYGTATKQITVQRDSVLKVNIELTPTRERTAGESTTLSINQDRGSLVVANTLPGEAVLLDGQRKGVGSVQLEALAAGSHTLTVAAFTKTITIFKDYVLRVRVDSSGITVLNDRPLEPTYDSAIPASPMAQRGSGTGTCIIEKFRVLSWNWNSPKRVNASSKTGLLVGYDLIGAPGDECGATIMIDFVGDGSFGEMQLRDGYFNMVQEGPFETAAYQRPGLNKQLLFETDHVLFPGRTRIKVEMRKR